jgi:hypothetical protein
MSDFNRVKQLFSAVYWPWVGFVSARFLVVFPCLLATGEKNGIFPPFYRFVEARKMFFHLILGLM